MEKNVTYRVVMSKELKQRIKKEKRKKRWKARLNWVENHAEEVAAIGGAAATVLAGVCKVAKVWHRKSVLDKERKLKERYVYDRSVGKYHHLRRTMTAAETKEFARRKASGEKTVNILESMRLL